MLFRGRPGAGPPVAPERDPRAEFFRANDTVYMVMEYEHGRTLQEFIQKHQGHISERFMRGVFTRMLNGLREVHSHKLLHLDLKPSNIYLRGDNTPVLIDFGAARQTWPPTSPCSSRCTRRASPRRNTTARARISGRGATSTASAPRCTPAWPALRPQAADQRLKKDTLAPAMMRWDGQFSDRLLEIIDWCLNLNHLYRPQSVFALQKALVETVTPPRPKAIPTGWAASSKNSGSR
jgi:serine/threonine protein kinase